MQIGVFITILFFFLTSFLVGWGLLHLLRIELDRAVLLASMVVGLVVTCLLLFGLGYVFPFSRGLVVVTEIILFSLSLLRIKEVVGEIREVRVGKKELVVWLGFILLVVWLFGRALLIGPDGQIIAGDRLVWTDWPVHFSIASNFAWGQSAPPAGGWRIPPQNPTFAGTSLIYPFFADFLSAVLLVLGANYPIAFSAPGIVLTLCFFGLFLGFTRETYAENKLLKELTLFTFLPLFLSLFWGGLGFVYWFKDLLESDVTFIERLIFPPHEYTFLQEKGQWFFTFLYSEILPQRAFLFGLPLFFLILILVKKGWEDRGDKGSRGRNNFLLAGILGGILPFFHTHTFLSLWFLSLSIGIVGGIWGIRNKKIRKALLYYFLPFGILTLIQLPFFRSSVGVIAFEFGWMKGQENFFLFWFKNTGFFIPLAVLGLWKSNVGKWVKVVGISSWILFILPNLFRFAPWGYDNLKILTYWYLINSIFVALALWEIGKIRVMGRILTVVLFLSLILSGMIEVYRIADTPHVQIQLWSREDQDFAQVIKEKTEPSAIFLTAAIHDHPVSSLSGRKIVIGYPGNSWSWGIKGWDERERDVHMMYQGGEKAKQLWKKYGIHYIIVSDRERYFEKNIDEEFINKNSQLVFEKGKYRVYKILK